MDSSLKSTSLAAGSLGPHVLYTGFVNTAGVVSAGFQPSVSKSQPLILSSRTRGTVRVTLPQTNINACLYIAPRLTFASFLLSSMISPSFSGIF